MGCQRSSLLVMLLKMARNLRRHEVSSGFLIARCRHALVKVPEQQAPTAGSWGFPWGMMYNSMWTTGLAVPNSARSPMWAAVSTEGVNPEQRRERDDEAQLQGRHG